MSFADLKPQIAQLPHDERLKVMAYLKHLLRADDPTYQADLARRHADIDAGKGIRWEELKRHLGST